jgi:hypothetical protein
MDAGTWHTREWSGDFLSPPLQVRDYLLMLNIFACMEKVRRQAIIACMEKVRDYDSVVITQLITYLSRVMCINEAGSRG